MSYNMKRRVSIFGLTDSVIILIYSVFMALVSGLLHDMKPADPYTRVIENLETIIFGCSGFVVASFGFAGSLLFNRSKKLSRAFLTCSAVLCVIYAIYY